ncbi:MAG: L-serine dehydratase, partial [Pseudonocardiales bacterium]|nr:L-serine dehydratase [Pseudonocardiales bacterium]
MISVFDLFSVGIGPSSSHTVGPMRAALRFVERLAADGQLDSVAQVRCELFGSLGATGHGHGSPAAVLLGLSGERPETVDTDRAPEQVQAIRDSGRLRLAGGREVAFNESEHLVLHRRRTLPLHPNGMLFQARSGTGELVAERTYYSVGGGFVLDDPEGEPARIVPDTAPVAHPFRTAADLLLHCSDTGLPVSGVMLANELS